MGFEDEQDQISWVYEPRRWRTSLKKHSITQFFRVFFNNGGFEMILCFLEEDEDEEWNVEWRKWCVYCLSRGFSMGLWEENGEMKRSEWRALFAILVFWEVEEACCVHYNGFIAAVTSQPQQINAFFFNFLLNLNGYFSLFAAGPSQPQQLRLFF